MISQNFDLLCINNSRIICLTSPFLAYKGLDGHFATLSIVCEKFVDIINGSFIYMLSCIVQYAFIYYNCQKAYLDTFI